MTAEPAFVTFLSDYGLRDDFVGICHGVIARGCPRARVIDLMHEVPRHDVRAGALLLSSAIAFMPTGVMLAVVDPGVGSARRAVALRTVDGMLLVGPDNGLLEPAAQAAGGVVQAAEIGQSRFALAPVSATFHGRDIFAPVAAALAAGTSLSDVGEPLDPSLLVVLKLRSPVRDGDELVAHVQYVDGFGNLQLDARPADLSDAPIAPGVPVSLTAPDGPARTARYVRTFADVAPEALIVYEDPDRRLSVAVNRGSAARLLGLGVDGELRIAARRSDVDDRA